MKKRTVLFTQCAYHEIFRFDFGLSVADIQIVAPVGAFFSPYPDVGNILVTGIAVEPALNIPFQIQAVRTCCDWIVPAVNRRAFQPQPNAHSVGFRIVDPSLNVKVGNGEFFGQCGFLRRLALGRFLRRRLRRRGSRFLRFQFFRLRCR